MSDCFSLVPRSNRLYGHVRRIATLLSAWAAVGLASADGARAAETGAQIYTRLCAACHGARGEGVANEYAQPLMGDKSILELSALIDKTMPSGEPDKCNAEEAKTVAAYIHETFYSPIAQARNQPPRIELSRLTVRQYRNLLTDLIGSFRWNNTWGKERGLKAEYFNSRNPNKSKREIERVDPQVKFNFADGSPLKDKIAAEEFSIQWMVRHWLLKRASTSSSSAPTMAPDSGSMTPMVESRHRRRSHSGDDREFPANDLAARRPRLSDQA